MGQTQLKIEQDEDRILSLHMHIVTREVCQELENRLTQNRHIAKTWNEYEAKEIEQVIQKTLKLVKGLRSQMNKLKKWEHTVNWIDDLEEGEIKI